jgi:predicted metal-dependent peptidase
MTDDSNEPSMQVIRDLSGKQWGADQFDSGADGLGLGEMFDDGSVSGDMKKDILERMVDEATKAAGHAPARLQRVIDEIKDKTNREWRRLIRCMGSSNRIEIIPTWSRVHKRCPWLKPGKLFRPKPKGICMVDTSASIGLKTEMPFFFMELNRVSDMFEIDMAFIDAKWDKDNPNQYVKGVNPGEAYKHAPFGGGGTMFQDFFDFMKQEGNKLYEFCLVLTDGETMDNPYVPGKLARYNYALMTPYHSQAWADQARKHGWQVAVIDDSKTRKVKR